MAMRMNFPDQMGKKQKPELKKAKKKVSSKKKVTKAPAPKKKKVKGVY